MKRLPVVGGVLLGAAICAGCAASRALTPLPAGGVDKVTQPVADLFIRAANDTRASGREVAGWCWSDAQTGRLSQVVRAGVGDDTNVTLALPVGHRGDYKLSCSWHTHLWGARVMPGPSKRDLSNSRLPQLRNIHHFVVDRHGIWHYADGRVLSMCPWNGTGTNFDAAGCRS